MRSVIAVGLSVCVCVRGPSVCPPFFSVIAATPSVKLLSSRRHARENKILERKRPGKLVKRTAAEVSVRQIEIAVLRFARVEKICWSACIDGLTKKEYTAEIIKGRAVSDLL